MIIRIRDVKGKIIAILLCVIIWYTEILQFRFIIIPNFLLFLGCLLMISFVSDLTKSKVETLKKTSSEMRILGIYLVLTLVLGIVVAPSISSHISHGISCIEYYLVMIVLCYYAATRESIQLFLWNYIIMYGVSVILFFINPQATYEGTQIRLSLSSSLNVNAFAMGLTMATWSILYLVLQKKINVAVGLAIVGIFIYAVFLTGSRKGLLGEIICIIFWLFLCYLPIINSGNKIKAFVNIVLIITVSVALISILHPLYSSSYMATRMQGLLNRSDASTIERMKMYSTGIRYLKQSPLLGYGFWGFAYYYGSYSHATLIEVPVSSGIPLAILYFYTYYLTWKKLRKNKNMINNRSFKEQSRAKVANKMSACLFCLMVFYTFSVIHIYEMSSFIAFALVYSANDYCNIKREGV